VAADRRRERHEALAALFDAEGAALDALLVTSRPNIRYLTGFSGSAGVAVATRADLLLVTDFRYAEQAQAEAGAVARVEIEGASVWDRLFKELPTLGPLTTVGYEAHAVTVKDAERFTAGAAGAAGKGWRWKPAGELVERLRACKDPAEIAAIRAAAALAGEALRATIAAVRPGQTELEIAGLLEGALRRYGSEGHPFPAIVASGPRSALPHAQTSRRTVAAGEWLLLDFGAVVDGYCADITRTVVVGARATDAQRALYELVAGAQRRAREGVRAGMLGREADALARDPIEARGFGDAFGHSTGHGLGLEVHEAPRLARTATEPLPLDAVVTIEPGVYVPGRGGVRIEDDVHLSVDGPVLLSDGHTDLVELV
jgi:Xaa-Pro aminopeptidase